MPSVLQCKRFCLPRHLTAPGFFMIGLLVPCRVGGYPCGMPLQLACKSASGPRCLSLSALNGLALLLGSPQQAPSSCHTPVVLRLGIFYTSTWELLSRVQSPSRPQSNTPAPDISLISQCSLQKAYSVPPSNLS